MILFFLLSSSAIRDPFVPTAITVTENSAMQTILIPIHYADATTVAEFLNNPHSHVISPSGFVAVDARTNQLFIRDKMNRVLFIQQMIKKLDVPISQVLIKARIISADSHFSHALGLLFHSAAAQTSNHSQDLALDLPVTTDINSANIPIIKFGNGQLLDLTLTALEQEGHSQLISSPELMTNNRQAAMIESGEEVPYQEKTGEGNTSVAFKKATLRLKVTPILLPNHRILLQLIVNQDKISHLLVNGVPAIQTQQLNTSVLLKDQETAVLGGIYEEVHQGEEVGLPGLRSAPIVGGLFRERQRLTQRKQLLIFITPRIIS